MYYTYICLYKRDIAKYREKYEISHPITTIVRNANRTRGYLSRLEQEKGSPADFSRRDPFRAAPAVPT